jgi:amidase
MRQLTLCFFLVTSLAIGETHQAIPAVYHHTFAHTNPVFQRIKPGDIVITKTLDSGGQNEKDEHASTPPNPLTGPFYIEGAEPGDALFVTFRKIRLNRNWGYTNYRLGLIALLPQSIEDTYPDRYKQDLVRKGRANLVPWNIDIARKTVHLREPSSKTAKLEFPASPMLGCVGVAAPGDFAPTSSPSGSYGGNLDYNRITEGATVILPVYHPGALLYVGDGHALMGDGEPTGTGIETSMDVEFSVALKKNANLTGPRVETEEYIISVGSQPEFQSSLDRALQLATTDMVRWLTEDYHLEPWAAHQLIGVAGHYDVVTVQGTMALRLAKSQIGTKP